MLAQHTTRTTNNRSVHSVIGTLFEFVATEQTYNLGKGDFTVSFSNMSEELGKNKLN